MLLSPLQAVQDKPVGLVSYVQQILMNRLTMHVCPSCQSAPPLFEQNAFHQQVALIVDLQPGPIASQELRFTCQVTKEEGNHSLSSDRFGNPPVHKWEAWGSQSLQAILFSHIVVYTQLQAGTIGQYDCECRKPPRVAASTSQPIPYYKSTHVQNQGPPCCTLANSPPHPVRNGS